MKQNTATTTSQTGTTTLEMKKVKIASNLSEETIAFTGELWVNGKLAARCKNNGQGGSNDYRDTYQIPNGNELVKEAEAYCKTLPNEPSEFIEGGLEMDLELWISMAVGDVEVQKEAEKFKKKMEKKMLNCIIIGEFDKHGMPVDGKYYEIKFKLPIAKYLLVPEGRAALVKTIIRERKTMGEKQVILNTNIPAEILNATEVVAAVQAH